MRWYDHYETLGRHLDSLKAMDQGRRSHLVRGIQGILAHSAPGLLDAAVMDFPLDVARQRWYDADPDLWLTINGLQRADPDLLETVALYLEEQAAEMEEA
ncbi:MAG: hypothetical protein M0T76_00705 [Desulfobacteraceae bacterium]|nr:hypothetical protein [Desulfobacteraceae bacterium]